MNERIVVGDKPPPCWSRRTGKAWAAPDLAAALRALEAGELPDDRTLRAAIRQLRRVLAYIDQRGTEATVTQFHDWADWRLELLRTALNEPRSLQPALCLKCQKRPRHFDAYCKRCAPERPRGKIT